MLGVNNESKMSVYFTIIDSVRENNKLPTLSISKQARNRYVRQLKIDGILIKKGFGVWEINEQNLKQLTSKQTHHSTISDASFTNLIRGHGWIIKVLLDRKHFWAKEFPESKPIYNRRAIEFRGFKIHLCKQSILIYFPEEKSIYNKSAYECQKEALYITEQLLIGLEYHLNTSLRIGKVFKIRYARRHYARVKDDLAKLQRDNKDKLQIRDNGELWLITDYSLSEDELEGVSIVSSDKDIDDTITPFMNSVRHNKGMTLDYIRETIGELARDRKEHAENIKTHITVLKEVAHVMKEFKGQYHKVKMAAESVAQRRLNEW